MHLVKPGEQTFYPHYCMVCECGQDDDRKLIDTEISQAVDDYDMRRYICTKCAARAASVIGLKPQTAELKRLKAENDKLKVYFGEVHEWAVKFAEATADGAR